jgi:hypothetical protein
MLAAAQVPWLSTGIDGACGLLIGGAAALKSLLHGSVAG